VRWQIGSIWVICIIHGGKQWASMKKLLHLKNNEGAASGKGDFFHLAKTEKKG
jgi:hypothetical protein